MSKFFLVKEIMSTKLITVQPHEYVSLAYDLMQKHKIRQLPVCINNKIVGIITDRDIRSAIHSTNQNTKKATISDLMTIDPITITENTPIEEAVKIINTKKFGSLPVCKEDKTLIGIVSITDISGFLLNILQSQH